MIDTPGHTGKNIIVPAMVKNVIVQQIMKMTKA